MPERAGPDDAFLTLDRGDTPPLLCAVRGFGLGLSLDRGGAVEHRPSPRSGLNSSRASAEGPGSSDQRFFATVGRRRLTVDEHERDDRQPGEQRDESDGGGLFWRDASDGTWTEATDGLATGVYLVRLEAGAASTTRRVVVAR